MVLNESHSGLLNSEEDDVVGIGESTTYKATVSLSL